MWQSFDRGAGNHTKVIHADGSNFVEENGNMLYVDNDMWTVTDYNDVGVI